MSYIMQEPGITFERRVPLALVFAVALHLGAALIWAAQLDTRVARIEKDIDRIANRLDVIPAKAGIHSRIDSHLRGSDV